MDFPTCLYPRNISTSVENFTASLFEMDELTLSKREVLNTTRLEARALSVVALITSVALSVLGIAAVSGGSAFFGGVFLLVSVPVIYFSYNVHALCENVQDILDEPERFKKQMSIEELTRIAAQSGSTCASRSIPVQKIWNKEKIYTHLGRHTFCFDGLLDLALHSVFQSRRSTVSA